MINQEIVMDFGQVKKGDYLLIEWKKGLMLKKVKEVLYPGTRREEILLTRKTNKYFVTSMYLSASSWVNRAVIVRVAK